MRERRLRIVACFSCGQPTGIPGAGFCDTCRPNAVTGSALYTPVDHERAQLTSNERSEP